MNWTFEKVRRFYLYVGVVVGMGIASGIRMIIHDTMGLEGYVEFMKGHWIHMSPAWGIGMTVFWLAVLWKARR